MDLSSIYIRLVFGGRGFGSEELDLLADRMNVSGLLSRNRNDRYFKTKGRTMALSLGSKVVVGSRFYDRLTADQRLALVAHEFVHIREGDNRFRLKNVLGATVAGAIALLLVSYVGTGSVLLSSFIASVGCLVTLSIVTRVNTERYREMELRCDRIAASYTDGEALITTLRIIESTVSPKIKRSWAYRRAARAYPTLDQRITAIHGVISRGMG